MIAAIAYNSLTPIARQQIDNYTQLLDPDYPPLQRFLYLSTLLDQRREQTSIYNSWHYINTPFSSDATPLIPAASKNIVWALQVQQQDLNNSMLTAKQRAEALTFIIHLVGDIHQPLHCTNRYSKEFPQGDEGGVKVLVEKDGAHNLHQWWDRGGRLFKERRKFSRMNQINYQAQKWMKEYPVSFFGSKLEDQDFHHWAEECFSLAVHVAYMDNLEKFYSDQYRKTAQEIIKQQIILAGYRLAFILNKDFDKDIRHEKTSFGSGSR